MYGLLFYPSLEWNGSSLAPCDHIAMNGPLGFIHNGEDSYHYLFFFMLWSGLCGKNKGNNIWICFDGGPQTHKSDLSIRLCLDASISIKIPFLLLGIRYISMQKVHSWKCTFPPAHLLLYPTFCFLQRSENQKMGGRGQEGYRKCTWHENRIKTPLSLLLLLLLLLPKNKVHFHWNENSQTQLD